MAAHSANSRPEGTQETNGDQFNEGGPSFTAVNGSNSPASVNKSKLNDEQAKENDDSNFRSLRPNSHQDQSKSPAPTRQDQVTDAREHPQSPIQNPPDDRVSSFTHPHEAIQDLANSRTPNSQQNNSTNNSTQKRKRSYGEEYDTQGPSAYHSHGLPPSPQRQRIYDTENGDGNDRDHPPPSEVYSRPNHVNASELYSRPDRSPPAENYPQPERHQLVRNEYDSRGEAGIAPARPYYSEARMAEALQRENNSYDAMPMHENHFASPEDEDEQHAQQYGDYSGNNCLRGGFVCEGYTARNTWQKPANPKAPIPLQSKNGYPPQPMQRNGSQTYSRYMEPSSDYAGPASTGQGIHSSHDGERIKPIVVDEDRDQNYAKSSPPNGQAKAPPGYSKASRPYPSNPPYASKYMEDEHRPGSTHENTPYESQDPNTMQPPPPVHRSSSSQSQYSTQSTHPPPHSNVQAVAQNALQHQSSLRGTPHRRSNEMTEREKMLKGNYYLPFSPALTQDRENCMTAIWRFNNATNPSHGASPEERQRLFRAIMAMRPTPEPAPPANGDGANSVPPQMSMPMPMGRVGERVIVEAPFHCDYGYNINIGNDVLIGADCRISDTCSVTIGDRCIFSPNVKLVCATYPIDPRRRMGSGGQALGRNIVIEEDCWIGSNVTILAGVRVGRSSTVGAGSLLHQDVPRFTVVAGNPAKVSRGIYDGNADGQ
ncbi:MAG: hypothetical protein LQ342_005859 [Letrouitia transgressa]|nr:MAG: hypothetical protein LQ342_005859 [Letrouitia transgressa]